MIFIGMCLEPVAVGTQRGEIARIIIGLTAIPMVNIQLTDMFRDKPTPFAGTLPILQVAVPSGSLPPLCG
jgi:hypothetical protein